MKQPRIAIYYENRFRNDGCPLYWYNVLKNQLNLDVMHLLPEGDTSRFGTFDYHFWIDFGEDALPTEAKTWQIPKDGGKTIYVASDTHLGAEYRFERAKQFEYVFFNQKAAVEEFGEGAVWLPHAAEPEAYPVVPIVKKYDVCFIGHFQDTPNYNGMSRIDALDRLFKEFPNFYFGTRTPQDKTKNVFEDAAKKFCSSKVVFNISIKDDINMRVFETLSTGSFLLTNYVPTLEDLFTDGKHLVMYRNFDELVEKARYYIEHDQEREAIAMAGHEEFMAKHTYRHRAETVLKIIGFDTSLINHTKEV